MGHGTADGASPRGRTFSFHGGRVRLAGQALASPAHRRSSWCRGVEPATDRDGAASGLSWVRHGPPPPGPSCGAGCLKAEGSTSSWMARVCPQTAPCGAPQRGPCGPEPRRVCSPTELAPVLPRGPGWAGETGLAGLSWVTCPVTCRVATSRQRRLLSRVGETCGPHPYGSPGWARQHPRGFIRVMMAPQNATMPVLTEALPRG